MKYRRSCRFSSEQMETREDIWNELVEGEIHFRDNLQFELKTEFLINPHLKRNIYKQEVFLFIPSSLQINTQTYSKQQFYLDQTNLIRYKTPLITLSDLINPEYIPSPLNRLQHILDQSDPGLFQTVASDELKLFGAIFRATIRERVHQLVQRLKQTEAEQSPQIERTIASLCEEISQVFLKFRQLQESAHKHADLHQLIRHFKYIDEFISLTSDEFLILLLKEMRSLQHYSHQVDKQICQLILKEQLYRKKKHLGPKTSKGHLFANESILYRQGLLNRFVLEALTLKNIRFSFEEKHIHILGAIAAGLAMLVYMVLFVRGSSAFLINSFPFVALAVGLYILKDRIKEGFKSLYYKQAHRWFPDYATEIRNSQGFKVGTIKENFAFIDAKELPPGFLKIRNHYFHEELQALHRHEAIIQYKREVLLNSPQRFSQGRRREITTIFRLNIHRFLEKASNPFQSNLSLDSYTQEISEKLLPKVYHLNLIIRNTYFETDHISKVEIKTFRVVIDKGGIKRVEHIRHPV